MNPATRSALRRFQKEHGLRVDGIAGPETEGSLRNARSARNGQGPESIQSEMSNAHALSGFDGDGEGGGAPVKPATLAAVPGIEKTSDGFRQKVIHIARGLGTDPNFLMAIMSFESGLDPKARNPYSGATGLIQFMPKTAARLGTTIDALARMTAEKQLTYVQKYFAPYRGRLHTLEDAYMAVLWPPAIGRGNNYVLFASPSMAYEQNRALDLNKDGKITVAEATSFVRKRLGTDISGHRPSSRPASNSNRSGRSKTRWVQRALNRIMGLRLAEDGRIGPATRSAIRSFQRRFGLAADGIVGPRTEAKINSLGAGNYPGHARSVVTVPATDGTSHTPSTPGLSTGASVVSVHTNARVSENAIRVLKLILRDAGLTGATISSGGRTSADQARIMYELIERDGVSYAKNLYGRYGDQVIAVYEAQKRAGRSATAIKQAMEDQIKARGCQYISHHCSDEYDVIDVAPSSIADENAFRRALKSARERGIIHKYIPPPEDPAFHIEIKRKQPAN
jgi:peptidoglycan hydrolase-like protein with peptidoglycan-binding domain